MIIRKCSFTGEIIVSCVIDIKGDIAEVQIPLVPDGSLRDEIIRIMNKMSGKWQAAKHRGQYITTQFHLPIRL